MKLENRLSEISSLLKEFLPFFSQWDLEVIQGNRFEHPWIDKVLDFDVEKLTRFDSERNFYELDTPEWIELNEKMALLTDFKIHSANSPDITPLGNKKKQHELKRLFSLLTDDQSKKTFDFGGGVGNLAYFLEQELSMDVTVLEKDSKLIETGIAKLQKLNSKVNFYEHHVGVNDLDRSKLSQHDLAIGLHTCGHFANDMFRDCIADNIPKIVNFGCCYSKIKDEDYHLSSHSDPTLKLNQRALSCATLSFNPIPREFYTYRSQIMEYKFSFYNWLYHEHGVLEFCSMSNARRSLYQLSFDEFVNKTLVKFFPKLFLPDKGRLLNFYHSKQNKELNHYLNVYYAISRYFGKLIETYILCDRALYLQENNYQVEIVEVFDPLISPRNKAIIGTLNT